MATKQILYEALSTLNDNLVSLSLGNVSADLTTISNETATTATNTTTLAGAISSSIMQTNVAQINGIAPSMGSGINGTGVQRITIATDDTLINDIDLQSQTIASNTTTMAGGITGSKYQINTSQVGGNSISVGSGSNGNGCQRVTIATNDQINSNLTTINNSIGTGNSSLSTISTNSTTLAGGVTSSKYQTNISQIGGSNYSLGSNTITNSIPVTIATNDYSFIQNYVRSLFSSMNLAYEYLFYSVPFTTTNTIYQYFHEATIGTNMNFSWVDTGTNNAGEGNGLVFNCTEAGSVGRSTVLETRSKIPLSNPTIIIYDITYGNFSANTSTLIGLTYNTPTGSVIGFRTTGSSPTLSVNDGTTSTNQSSWNFDTFNGSGPSGQTITFNSSYKYPIQQFVIHPSAGFNFGVIFGIILNGIPYVCHQSKSNTSTSEMNIFGTLQYKVNCDVTLSDLLILKSVKIYDLHVNNMTRCLKNIISVCGNSSGLSFSALAGTKTLFSLAYNTGLNIVNFIMSLRKINIISSASGAITANLYYYNSTSSGLVLSGGTATSTNVGASINNSLTLNQNYSAEPSTATGLLIASQVFNQSCEMDFKDIPTWMLIGVNTNTTKCGIYLQITSDLALTATIFFNIELAFA